MDLFDIISLKNKKNIRFVIHFPEQAQIFLQSILPLTRLKLNNKIMDVHDLKLIDFKSVIGISISQQDKLTIYYHNKNFDDFYLNDYKQISIFSNSNEELL